MTNSLQCLVAFAAAAPPQAGGQGGAPAARQGPAQKLSVDSMEEGRGPGGGLGPVSLACPQFLQTLGPDIYTAGEGWPQLQVSAKVM
jgi:hypothetical protein